VTGIVTKPLTNETLRRAFGAAISEITLDESGDDASVEAEAAFKPCVIIFGHPLSDFEQAQVQGGLLAFQLSQSDWLNLDSGRISFVVEGQDRTTVTFFIDTSRLSDAIHMALA